MNASEIVAMKAGWGSYKGESREDGTRKTTYSPRRAAAETVEESGACGGLLARLRTKKVEKTLALFRSSISWRVYCLDCIVVATLQQRVVAEEMQMPTFMIIAC